jgi:hypothetical protein
VIYTPDRWIGVLEKGSVCPNVPGWTTQTLLELSAAHASDGLKKKGECAAPLAPTLENLKSQAKVAALFHKHGLDRYCVYTSQGSGREFRKPAGLKNAEPDRMAVTASSPTDLGVLGHNVWQPLAEQFLAQVGRVQLGGSSLNPVRVVFVDSYPTGEGVPAQSDVPASWHGYGMAHLVNEIVCGHGPAAQGCSVQIATRLALRYDGYHYSDPFSPYDTGSELGGHQGRIGDLVTEIAAEILLWSSMPPPRPKLILNLSVGWDGEYVESDSQKALTLGGWTDAVYAALSTAHDLGVLVIAAAGNRPGGEVSHQPLLPAAWELQPRSLLDKILGKKVVYAVGGVDWQGLPLPNARPAGLPMLVAYADHAVVSTADYDGQPADPTRIYTGSSVAAAVASAIAAVTWHLEPSWAADDVMVELTNQVDPNPGTATFYSGSSAPGLKRLSLRKTVSDLCLNKGAQCLAVIPQSPAPPPANLADFAPPPTVGPIAPPACDPQTAFLSAGSQAPDSSCPIETLQDMSTPAMTQPQPGETPCPPCNLAPVTATSGLSTMRQVQVASLVPQVPEPNGDSGGPKPYSLAADLDPHWVDQAHQNHTTIESAILVIDCENDPLIRERVDVTPQFQDLLSGTAMPPVKINLGTVGGRTTLAGCSASVDFTLLVTVGGVTSQRSVQSPVYVDP